MVEGRGQKAPPPSLPEWDRALGAGFAAACKHVGSGMFPKNPLSLPNKKCLWSPLFGCLCTPLPQLLSPVALLWRAPAELLTPSLWVSCSSRQQKAQG